VTDQTHGLKANQQFPAKYFVLVLVFSLPFWLLGEVANRFLPDSMPINLPISSLMAVCPLLAAAVMKSREGGTSAVFQLLRRSFDFRRIKRVAWYLPTLLLMPAIMILEFALLRLLRIPLPDLQWPVLMLPVFAIMFFAAALTEELGWQGYAFNRLPDKWSALGASLFLGVVWAVWHIIPFLQAGRSPDWIFWQCLNLIVTRVVIVWLFVNTGKSVFAASLFHTMINVTAFLFPHFGSHYDPFITWILVTIVAATVTSLWGPKTLARPQWKHTGAPMSGSGSQATRRDEQMSDGQFSIRASQAEHGHVRPGLYDTDLISDGTEGRRR
jgi:membrane protease YdiL (CAAX protease family)